MPRNGHREYWVLTQSEDVAKIVRGLTVPGKVLIAEHTRYGSERMFHVEMIATKDEEDDFLTTLDALLAMGAKIFGRVPPKKHPPEDN